MKKILLLLYFIMLTFIAVAQGVDEIRPSVNARQFISALSSDVGLRTGQVIVNIPLFSLPGKGIDIPISLTFNGEGITHESEASQIGLGWSLSAGGVLTATIRGKDDRKTKKYDDIPWQYRSYYLEDLWKKQSQNPYSFNEFVSGMYAVMSRDTEPDSYQYSFLGYSGDISFKFNQVDQTKREARFLPDSNFKIIETSLGYKIIADNGIEYFFEVTETNKIVHDTYTTCWFLSAIKTVQEGYITFHYEDEEFYDLSFDSDRANAFGGYPLINSKRLVRINSEYGRVEFLSETRSDTGTGAKKIINIELYNNENILVKGYKLENVTAFANTNPFPNINWHNRRLRLDKIIEYNSSGEYLPPYKFNYDYSFSRSKSSYRYVQYPNFPSTVNSWAENPSPIAIVDRNTNGHPACYMVNDKTPYERVVGYDLFFENFDITYNDYFCLSRIEFPTGKIENFEYENHDYRTISGSNEPINSLNTKVRGKRLKRKYIWISGNIPPYYVEYKYRLHNENYEGTGISSGVLVAPPIHTSTLYKPLPDNNGYDRFQATTYTSKKPQNILSGSPVYYTEVEEIFKGTFPDQNTGKKIYYFQSKVSFPGMNYMYSDYRFVRGLLVKANILVPLQNRLHGTLENYPAGSLSALNDNYLTYMAYPVGSFSIYDGTGGKVIKEVSFDTQGRVVQKIENAYERLSMQELYGLKIIPYNDGNEQNRFLICRSIYPFEQTILSKRIITKYFPDSGTSVSEEESFTFLGGGRIGKNIIKLKNNDNLETTFTYPDMINFDTQTNLSQQAFTIKRMIELNMLESPIQITKKKGGKIIEGTYFTYKQANNGTIVTDTIFNLENKLEPWIRVPFINTAGKVERNSNFSEEKEYTAYDENANPISIKLRDNVSRTFKWGYGGQYVIAQIINYTHNQLEGNSVLNNLLKSLENYTVITDSSLADLLNCNKAIRNNLPNDAMITTYTYNPMFGMTSVTDTQGNTICYDYDSFGRLTQIYQIKNGKKEILKLYKYHYRNQ